LFFFWGEGKPGLLQLLPKLLESNVGVAWLNLLPLDSDVVEEGR